VYVEIVTAHNMQVSEYVGVLLAIFSICSILVQVLVLIAVFHERKYTKNVFYTLYAVGSIADMLSLVDAVFLYSSLTGILQFQFFGSDFTAKVSHHIVWGARSSQLLTVLLIASNRFTAIYFPLKQPTIWNRITEFACAFFQISSIIVNGIGATIILRPIWIKSYYGGIVTLYDTEDSIRKPVFICALMSQIFVSMAIMLFYVAIFRKFKSRKSYHAIDTSLYWFAISICAIEILSIVQHTVSTQFNWTPESKTCLFIIQTVVYNSIPPFLFLIFSKNIRKHMYFTVKRHRPSLIIQLSHALHFRDSRRLSTSITAFT
ncbi:hypothetical protein PRIPAC_79812, partial [Pristionchus pacificus]|uniref:Serpentine receptor class gamma n=1 Tax=Pristionchus pacificus TaxID=54126 RepID=A0A2A6CLF3_PRIPA